LCLQPAITGNAVDAAANCSFLYLPNPGKLPINFSAIGIRVISLPIPTQIITSDFVPGSTISAADPKQIIFTPGVCDASSSTPCGLAAAHIFDYQGATTLSKDGITQIGSPSTGSDGDYHFRTVPPHGAGLDHTVCMFRNLLSLITGFDPNEIALGIPDKADKALEGPYIPLCVGDPELDIPALVTATMTTASCAAGGLGIGGGH